MDDYKRWRNAQEPGALMFVTTTCHGWVPAFRTPEAKRLLLACLVEECDFRGAILHAYCIMEHHLHLVIRAPMGTTMSRFMQSFKSRSAKRVLAGAHPWILRRLREEEKDGRSLWMRSFRGIPIRSERVFWSSIRYVHLNPVRAGICEDPLEYPWSSARLFENCQWDEELGLSPAILKHVRRPR